VNGWVQQRQMNFKADYEGRVGGEMGRISYAKETIKQMENHEMNLLDRLRTT
jgi:hypothetical protein